MKSALFIALCLGLAAYAAAECANGCSGHGTCGTKDQCTCYPNWQAADCSERTCPFGLSFVDTPQGDLNHDGVVGLNTDGVSTQWANKNTWELFPFDPESDSDSDYSNAHFARTQEAHFYVECSNKGKCNRESGLCECLDGYEGSSCQRTSCPNSCSGHGVCRTVEEIAAGNLTKRVEERLTGGATIWSGVATAFTYDLWDKDKNQGCVCDAGFTGYDCSLRQCPRGDDPMTHTQQDCLGYQCRNERQILTFECDDDADDVWNEATDVTCDGVAVLHYDSWDGRIWTSNQFGVDVSADGSTIAATVKAQLEGLPNSVIENVYTESNGAWGAGSALRVTVDFWDNSGNVMPIRGEVIRQDAAHYSLNGVAAGNGMRIVTTTPRDGNKEEVTCSNRGLCDYETGVCKCFKGFYDDDCSVQHALAL